MSPEDLQAAQQQWIGRWLSKAESDLAVARNERAVQNKAIVTEAICFHCRQAVEKLLKAFLLKNEVEFPRTHDLEYLVELCAPVCAEFRALEIGELTDYAVAVRYPSLVGVDPTIMRADREIEIASRARAFVLAHMARGESNGT